MMKRSHLFVLGAALLLPGVEAQAQAQAQATPSPAAAPSAPGKKAPVRRTVPATRAAAPAAVANRAPATDEAAARLASERAEVERLRATTLGLVRLMVQEGVLSKEKAARLLGDAEAATLAGVEPPAAKPPAVAAPTPSTDVNEPATNTESAPATTGRRRKSGVVRVPYLPETVKNEIREELRQEVLAQAKSERWAEPGALPEWLDRIAWEGDFRLRYQRDGLQDSNTPPLVYNAFNGTTLNNTQDSQDLLRIRMRLGLLAKISDTFGLGIRIATGSLNNPVSTNQTLGNSSRPYQLVLDRAYLRWDPSERWSVAGGRIPNPWFWPTDLVWDEDLNFEGVAASFKPRFSEALAGFVTAGVFPLQKNEPTPTTPGARDKWLYGMQAGGEWAFASTRVKLAAGLFDYRHVEGRPNSVTQLNANDWTVPSFRQKGNTVFDINQTTGGAAAYGLASKFRLVNIGAEVDFARFDPLFVKFGADYVQNIGFDRNEILARTGLDVEPRTRGYQARFTVGDEAIKKLHDWQAFFGYRHIERDAVPDGYTDSDFYLGGTDNRGYFIGGFYGLDRNAFVRARYLSGSPISGTARGTGSSLKLPLEIDVLQVDLNVRF